MAREVKIYTPSLYGKKEEELHRLFEIQMEDSKRYFLNVTRPRLDRAFKLYIAYNGDRKKEIKNWQANIFVPYVQAVVETLMPRILDARPEFGVTGRSEEDHEKAQKQQDLANYFWEQAGMDKTTEDFTRSCLIYGIGFMQVSWKKDVRELRFLKTKDVAKKTFEWKKEKRVFYDAPYCEWVDNYSLWYDWHNTEGGQKQYWFKRLVLSKKVIERRYPGADTTRLQQAFNSGSGDLTDYAAIKTQVRTTHESIVHGKAYSTRSGSDDKYNQASSAELELFEVFEWWRPFDDSYAVMVGAGHVPIFKGGEMPIPYDFKESPFIYANYLGVPGDFEGMGIPLILENPQIMLNLIKNQRLDAATLNIHKMWIVNPLANINKNELVTRPFGIIYSIDPQGVREVQFSDVKQSAYQEEEMLKSDMRYSSGVDDFSMGVGGGAGSATEVRHLRESTLERVRLFINHLGDAYSDVLRYWIDMTRQFMTKSMTIRIVGENGEYLFPLIEKDDLMGKFDYVSKVLPSIAGMQDVAKKQAMDLFQLVSQIPPEESNVDIKKLLSKLLYQWDWSLDSISKDEEEAPSPEEGMTPEMMAAMGQDPSQGQAPTDGQMPQGMPPMPEMDMSQQADPQMSNVLSLLRSPGELPQATLPTNLLDTEGPPPTVKGVPAAGGPGPARRKIGHTTNPSGFNRMGKVNTNVSNHSTPESQILNQTFNTQR